MKIVILTLSLLFTSCLIDARVDWDDKGKIEQKLSYDHPHDGNLTRAEIRNDPTPTSSVGGYRIKSQEELNGVQPTNCVSKIAKCMSNCNANYDLSSSIFALKVAVLRAKRSICYDECYNDVTPGCDYPLKRIQY